MAGEDRHYSDWIRRQPCCMDGCPDPSKPSEQHHAGGAGMGLRANDRDSMPLCRECHHVRLGRMPKEARREFERLAVAHHQAKFDLECPFPHEQAQERDVF